MLVARIRRVPLRPSTTSCLQCERAGGQYRRRVRINEYATVTDDDMANVPDRRRNKRHVLRNIKRALDVHMPRQAADANPLRQWRCRVAPQ